MTAALEAPTGFDMISRGQVMERLNSLVTEKRVDRFLEVIFKVGDVLAWFSIAGGICFILVPAIYALFFR